jgi:hypothetical protein
MAGNIFYSSCGFSEQGFFKTKNEIKFLVSEDLARCEPAIYKNLDFEAQAKT